MKNLNIINIKYFHDLSDILRLRLYLFPLLKLTWRIRMSTSRQSRLTKGKFSQNRFRAKTKGQ